MQRLTRAADRYQERSSKSAATTYEESEIFDPLIQTQLPGAPSTVADPGPGILLNRYLLTICVKSCGQSAVTLREGGSKAMDI